MGENTHYGVWYSENFQSQRKITQVTPMSHWRAQRLHILNMKNISIHHTLSSLPIFPKAISKEEDLVIVNTKIESDIMMIQTHPFDIEQPNKDQVPQS